MQKYALLRAQLLHEGVVEEGQFFEPGVMPEDTLLLAHDADYWTRTRDGLWSRSEERRSGFPWSAAMVERERVIMQGTLECAERCLASGTVSMNIAGGTHHAYADRAEGSASSTTSPLPPCTVEGTGCEAGLDCGLRRSPGQRLSLAARQGTTCHHVFDARASTTHSTKNKATWTCPFLTGRTTTCTCLVEDASGPPAGGTRPDMVMYQCGVDILSSDKLGRLGVSMEGCAERDRMVFDACASRDIPWSAPWAAATPQT